MFVIPEDISALSDSDLAAAITSALEEYGILRDMDDADVTDENLDRMEALASFVTSAREDTESREAAVTARAERLAAARTAVTEPEAPAEEAVEEEPAAVVAATPARRVTSRRIPEPVAPPAAAEVAVLTAAADVPGFGTGAPLTDLNDVAKAVTARMGALPKTRVGNQFTRYGVARITRPREDGLSQDTYASDLALVDEAGRESRLGQSLTASGGWCAPSQVLYDLFSNESTDGILDLPEVNVSRGGIKFTKGPQFSDIYDDIGFAQTEAEAIAATPKDCYLVECPTFEEVRLDAVGVCIKAGILTQVGYPELIRRYIEGALIAHQHKIAARLIAAMNTKIGAATSLANVFPNAISLLTALEMVSEGERQRYRLAYSETLEVLLPRWVRPAIRADLANRNGVDFLSVTDAQIDSHFAARGLRVQWLYNYQPLTGTPVADYPATLEAIIYPAGTWVKGTTDVITLDAVYDSTGLETNTYTALFAEEGVLLANRRNDARRISLPFNVSGLTAANNINQDWNDAGPLNTVPEITVTA
jgi:hypothetical protein